MADALAAGQVGCLRAGVYQQDVTIRHGGIVLRSYPGERATVVGRLYIRQGADYTTVSDLNLVGLEHGHACAAMCPSPTVNASYATFVNDDVTNYHGAASCFLLGDSNGVWGAANHTTIERSRIHDCGTLPPTNYDHGIYLEESRGSKIIDNAIYGNADRGIQLYPHATGTLILGNVIDGNGEGVSFGAHGPQTSSDNLVEDNIIIDSRVLYNIEGAYGPGDRVGTGNVVRGNCIGGGAMDNAADSGGIRANRAGFVLSRNVLAVPILSRSLLAGAAGLPPRDPCRGMRLMRAP